MAHDLEQLKQDHPDVAKLFADDWLQYRKSEILPELTREAQSTCDRINRIYFEDTAEAERLFRELVPEAGEGVDFRPPIRLDYGLGLKIGDRTFINMDLLIVGGTSLAVYPAAGLIRYFRGDDLVVINKQPTPADGMATLLVNKPIGQALSETEGEGGAICR